MGKALPVFRASNWYWIVAGSTSQVYTSSANSFVASTNAVYQTWIAANNKATRIDTLQNLADVLVQAGLPFPPGVTASSDELKSSLFDNIPRAVQVWAFAVDNRVRALEGSSARTPAQFKAYVIGLPGL